MAGLNQVQMLSESRTRNAFANPVATAMATDQVVHNPLS
jgi:hypothetical protein